jgi:hypothetical protein
MQQNRTEDCTHETFAERALTGTWVLDELRLAVQHGYEVVEVHEVYVYQVTSYDLQTGDGRLFAQYINTFLKLKAEASGYPNWVQCPADEDKYISVFHASEGILLNRDSIGPNPAKRGLAKLCLNSMWGKLTKRNNRTHTKMDTDPQELYRFLETPGIEVAALVFASDEVVFASWRYIADETVPNIPHTNEVIGAYVTAGAIIHLYSYLAMLKQMALYCDTDSVIYIQPDDHPALTETEDCLGATTSELKLGFQIDEFVSGGPKNYAYRTINPATGEHDTMHVGGITLNYSSSRLVNFGVLRHMILGGTESDRVTVHTEHKIKRK